MTTKTVIQSLLQLFSIFGMPQYIHSDRGTSFMSDELQSFLKSKGIATSRTTPRNPQGNGQVERLNDTLWKTISLILKSRKLPIFEWECVLQDALHSIRSLLCTETNVTPHERMFQHSRRSATGNSLPSWLLTPGPVYLKRGVRTSKYESLVDEVELIEANNLYAHVRHQDGRESTVSLRHLAPVGGERTTEVRESNPSPTEEAASPRTSPLPSDTTLTEHAQSIELNQSDEPGASPESVQQPAPDTSPYKPFIRTTPYNLRSGAK